MAWLATLVTHCYSCRIFISNSRDAHGPVKSVLYDGNDGLLPKIFSDLHPRFRTPYKSNIVLFVFVGLFAAFVPGTVAGDLTSIGTLFAFVLVCLGIMILRKKDPDLHRPFKTPLVPLVPILGILVCAAMIISLPNQTLLSAFMWMIIGLIVYFTYGKRNSKLGLKNNILPTAADFEKRK